MIYDFLVILINKIKLIGSMKNENLSKIVFFFKNFCYFLLDLKLLGCINC